MSELSEKMEREDMYFRRIYMVEHQIFEGAPLAYDDESLLIDDMNEILRACGEPVPEDPDEYAGIEIEVVTRCLEGKTGILAVVATPVPRPSNSESSLYSTSWSLTTSRWFYAQTLEEIFEQALDWKNAVVERKVAAIKAARNY